MKKVITSLFCVVFFSQFIISCTSDPGGELGSPPASPQLTAVERDASVELTWTPVNSALAYKVYWSTADNFTIASAEGSVQVNTNTFTHESLTNETTYYYAATALNAAGEGALSAIVAVTPIAPPSKPTIITAIAGNAEIQVQWPAQQNVSVYDIAIATNPMMVDADIYSDMTSPHTIQNLVNGQEYYISVRAINNSGSSEPSTPVLATPTKTHALAAGFSHNCVIKSDRTAWCWGRNYIGQLGFGGNSAYPSTSPVQVNDTAVMTWSAISAGAYFSCGIDTSSRLWCWGANGQHQLGNGLTDHLFSPSRVGSDSDWLVLESGSTHSCAIKTDNTLWCWGGNLFGQTGRGDFGAANLVPIPAQVGVDEDWRQLSLGGYISCAIKLDGSLWCWGESLASADDIALSAPERVNDDIDWRSIDVGTYHACAIKVDGSLWCWGKNLDGQIGIGFSTVDAYVPAPRRVGTDFDWLSVKAGGWHTCAIKTDNSLWCWGYNEYGQLGDSTQFYRDTPFQIGARTDWVDLTLNGYHTCASNKAGDVYCWGSNGYGELGGGEEPRLGTQNSYVPILTDNNNNWLEVAAGYGHMCASKTDNSVYCWGVNNAGQLGNQSYFLKAVPTEVVGNRDWRQFDTTSSGDTACGIKTDNSLWCWGRGVEGQFGNGSSGNDVYSDIPLQVDNAVDWAQIAVAYTHVCAIKMNNSLWCWGESAFGKLGIGSGQDVNTYETSPRRVGLDSDWIYVATGGWHTCAIKANNSLWCWGSNDSSQVGNDLGTGAVEIDVPVQVGANLDWASVYLGGLHSCALKLDGSAWCWGDNGSGQTGNNDSYFVDIIPFRVGPTDTWQQFSAGYQSSCAIKTDQSLWCWGNNYIGQVGNGFISNAASQQEVSPGTTWKNVGIGEAQTCGIKTDGTLWCWGANSSGSLGDGLRFKSTPQLVVFP